MEHFIKNIEITNFKSIRHAEVKDCRRVNVFVGPPNVGKSNILEAMSLFSVLRDRNLKSLIRVKQNPTLFFDGQISQQVIVSIDDKYLAVASYEHEQVEISFLFQKFEGLVPFNISNSNNHKLPFTYKTITYRDFENAQSNGPVWNTQIEVKYPKIKKYDFQKNFIPDAFDYRTLNYPFGNNLFAVIQSNDFIRKDLVKLVKSFNYKFLFDSSYQSLSLLKTLDEDNVFSIDYSLIADTLQRLFFYKTAILSNEKEILLFEEPEAHSYEPYIMEFTNSVKRDKNGNQFFIVTHSQYVIEELLREAESRNETNIYLVGLENNSTKIKLIDDEIKEEIYQTGLNVFFNYQSLWNEMSEHEAVH